MLVHQLRRLNSPASFVTAKDAQFWPMLLRGENTTDEERAQEGMFDGCCVMYHVEEMELRERILVYGSIGRRPRGIAFILSSCLLRSMERDWQKLVGTSVIPLVP
jgi:hypothetical protein